jgi:hypothetical protein
MLTGRMLLLIYPSTGRLPLFRSPRRSKFKQCVLSTRQEQGPEEDRSIDLVSYRLWRCGSSGISYDFFTLRRRGKELKKACLRRTFVFLSGRDQTD